MPDSRDSRLELEESQGGSDNESTERSVEEHRAASRLGYGENHCDGPQPRFGTTVELPLTPAMRAIIQSEFSLKATKDRSSLLFFAILSLPSLIFILASGFDARAILWGLGIYGCMVMFMLVIAIYLRIRANIDLKNGVFLRTKNSLRKKYESGGESGDGTYYLIIDRYRLPVSEALYDKLTAMPEATVDHTKHSRIPLELRDGQGQVVYRHPGLA